jgi:GntR family transcriptional regulator, rspAB operon transcriptional repressor
MDAIDRIAPRRLDRLSQAAPQVFETLRELILNLELPPGTVLPRAELAQRYGVSQTPVRDALTKLGEEGLVAILPQHATVVSRIDISAAAQAHFLRRSLELELVHELVQRSAEELAALVQQLRTHIAGQSRAHAAQDFAAFTQADRAFHQVLYDSAGMGELHTLMRDRSGHVDCLRRLHLPTRGKAQSVIRDHKAIVLAIESRHLETAQRAVRRHLAGTLAFVHEVRRRHPHWVVG